MDVAGQGKRCPAIGRICWSDRVGDGGFPQGWIWQCWWEKNGWISRRDKQGCTMTPLPCKVERHRECCGQGAEKRKDSASSAFFLSSRAVVPSCLTRPSGYKLWSSLDYSSCPFTSFSIGSTATLHLSLPLCNFWVLLASRFAKMIEKDRGWRK